MTVAASDISIVLSGGSSNINPDASLGGDPSAQPILMSRLFDDLTQEQTAEGRIDYRCVYLTNDNASSALYNTEVFVWSEVSEGADITLGFLFRDDRQQLSISNYSSLTGGNFTIRYETTNVVVAYDSTPATFASNLQTALESIGEVTQGVSVSSSVVGPDISFEIDFLGDSGMRYHPLITEISNDLLPASASTITLSKLVNGSPINSVADELDAATTPPSGVAFSYPTESAPLAIGTVHALDVVPLWIKRTVIAGATAVENDGVTIRVRGEPIVS